MNKIIYTFNGKLKLKKMKYIHYFYVIQQTKLVTQMTIQNNKNYKKQKTHTHTILILFNIKMNYCIKCCFGLILRKGLKHKASRIKKKRVFTRVKTQKQQKLIR